MCKTVCVFTVLLALGCGIANAQTVGISVTQKKDENARKRIWEYTFQFSKIQDNQRRFEIRLPLPLPLKKGQHWWYARFTHNGERPAPPPGRLGAIDSGKGPHYSSTPPAGKSTRRACSGKFMRRR